MTSTINVRKNGRFKQKIEERKEEQQCRLRELLTYVLTDLVASSHVSAMLINVYDARHGWLKSKLHSAGSPKGEYGVSKHTSEPSRVLSKVIEL